MIDQATASNALAPLWELFPKSDDEPGYQDQMTRALAESCQDEAHAQAAVKRLIRVSTFRPMPAEVYQASDYVREGLAAQQPPPWRGFAYACDQCQDTGWIVPSGRGAVWCPGCRKSARGTAS